MESPQKSNSDPSQGIDRPNKEKQAPSDNQTPDKEQISQEIWQEITKVIDPEIGLSIVDLGLIYKVDLQADKTIVIMTFTSMACPYGPQLRDQVYRATKKIIKDQEADVQVVFTPPWNPYEMASDEAKMFLGLM